MRLTQPSTQLFEPGCCRTPPPSSRRQRRALARGARAKPSAVSGHHPGTRMSPCGGKCRVGRTWRRVSCWSHAAARWPVVASARRRRRAAPILGAASIARSPPTNDRRRPPRGGRPLPHRAPHRRLAQLAHPAPSISHAHRSPRPRAPQSERCHKPPQRSCLNRGAVAHHPLARAASAAPSRARTRGFGASGLTRVLPVLWRKHHKRRRDDCLSAQRKSPNHGVAGAKARG